MCLLRGTDWIFIYNSLYVTLYSPVFTICTTSLTFNNSTFCPHNVFMCFVWIWEQTAILSLYNINWLVFIREKMCLLRGTDWESELYKATALWRQTMPWLRPLIAGLSPRRMEFDRRSIHVRFLVIKMTPGQVFLRILQFYTNAHTHLHPPPFPCQKDKGASPGKLSKALLFRKSRGGGSSKSSSDAIYSYEGLKTADQNRAIVFLWFVDQELCFFSSPMGTLSVLFTFRYYSFLFCFLPPVWQPTGLACNLTTLLSAQHRPGSSNGKVTELLGWTFWDRIPVGTRFSARPDRPWGPLSLL